MTRLILPTAFAGAVLALLFLGRLELRIAGPFAVLPQANADVRAQVAGLVVEVRVDEGDSVTEDGDVVGGVGAKGRLVPGERLAGHRWRVERDEDERQRAVGGSGAAVRRGVKGVGARAQALAIQPDGDRRLARPHAHGVCRATRVPGDGERGDTEPAVDVGGLTHAQREGSAESHTNGRRLA